MRNEHLIIIFIFFWFISTLTLQFNPELLGCLIYECTDTSNESNPLVDKLRAYEKRIQLEKEAFELQTLPDPSPSTPPDHLPPEYMPKFGTPSGESWDYDNLDPVLFPPLKTIKPWGTKFSPTRIWCLCPTLWPLQKTHVERIAETWGRHCDKMIFVIGHDDEESPPLSQENAVFWRLNITRKQSQGTRNIWEKVYKMWIKVYTDHLEEAEWFLKVDDDSFVAYHNLQGFLQYYNADEPHYLGHVLLHRWKNDNIAFNSGTCYVVSRESIRRVGPILQSMPQGHGRCRGVGAGGFGRFCQCIDRSGDEEDPTMSLCLRQVGIYAENTLDREFRIRFHPFQPQDHKKIKKENSWFWRYQHPNRTDEENCCHGLPVTYHNYKKDKYTEQWYDMDKEINVPKDEYPIPPAPRHFLYDPEIPFSVDAWRNIERTPKGQTIFLGNRTWKRMSD